MKTKVLELRDSGTFIALLAVDMNPTEQGELYLLMRCGYASDGEPNIAITRLDANGSPCWNDPYGWQGGARTFPIAHNYIIEHWNELTNGDVVDVEWILGERTTPKQSEQRGGD